MFGLGCYVGSLIIRSSLVSDLLAEAKVSALKEGWVRGRKENDLFVLLFVGIIFRGGRGVWVIFVDLF